MKAASPLAYTKFRQILPSPMLGEGWGESSNANTLQINKTYPVLENDRLDEPIRV
jgi:hypothetical protein